MYFMFHFHEGFKDLGYVILKLSGSQDFFQKQVLEKSKSFYILANRVTQ